MNVFKPGIYGDIPENLYHADQTSLSSTGAKTLINKTPAEFKWQQSNPVHKREFDFGSLAHRLALGVGPYIAIINASDWRTKAAKEARDNARDVGHIPVLQKDWDKAQRMMDALFAHRTAAELLSGGAAEQSLYWDDPETWTRLRGRVDYLHPTIVLDYKTAADASPAAFTKAIANFGYHQQDAWYEDGLAALDHKVDEFLFIVQCVEPPFLVSINRIGQQAINYGRELNRRAINLYANCQLSGEWPGYDPSINTLELPAWAYSELEMQ